MPENLPKALDFFRPERRANLATKLLLALISALLCFDCYALVAGITNTIDDYYGFRQTQTALTAYWLAKEPHTFAYLTPVLGSPWSIPFEFPIYQWIVVLLMKAGVPIVVAGRIISFAAFVGCIVPLRMLARDFSIPDRAFLISVVIYLASPFYIFYARTFMIETTALLFALCWLAGLVRSRTSPGAFLWLATLGFGILAVLTKSTTFLSIGPIAGVVFVVDTVEWLRSRRHLPRLIASGALCAIPLMAGYVWVEASDQIKSLNPFGQLLDFRALFTFNFGTISQRLSLHRPILRSLTETFGYFGNVIPILAGFAMLVTKRRLAIGAAVASYLVAFVIFTGLHTIHDYYHVANAVFACVAVGLSIDGLIETPWKPAAPPLLACVVVSQFHFLNEYFWQPIRVDNIGAPFSTAALAARDLTKANESLLIFGVGWSSVIPFYAERKSLAVPRFTPDDLMSKVLANPQAFTGDYSIGAIVDCRLSGQSPYRQSPTAAIEAFMKARPILYSNEWCRILAP